MTSSLRTKVSKLKYQGHLTKDEADRIRDALAKQIPQAVDIDFIPYNNTEDSARVFICPECTEEVERELDYCPSCGQRLDWSEENDNN